MALYPSVRIRGVVAAAARSHCHKRGINAMVSFTSFDVSLQAPWVLKQRPPSNWPSRGEISMMDYRVRYRPELELVLDGISCDIKSTEKVRCCGEVSKALRATLRKC